jgi:hypothetical protein
MVDINYYLNNDYFNIGNHGDKQVKRINILLLGKFKTNLVVIGVFIFSALFYLIMFTLTNFHSLGELSSYMEVTLC